MTATVTYTCTTCGKHIESNQHIDAGFGYLAWRSEFCSWQCVRTELERVASQETREWAKE